MTVPKISWNYNKENKAKKTKVKLYDFFLFIFTLCLTDDFSCNMFVKNNMLTF